ncbi:MAG: prolyl oligopeptidase family serine peptidase, partial [Candidatus Binatia bacterium]
AKPLGRGQEIWYEHVGELDVLAVIDDVARHYAVDPDAVYLGGVSMGGLGTIKIAEQHPDRFAGIFPSVPAMSDRAQGYVLPANNDWDLVELVPSLRNLPVRNFTGTYDALVPAGLDSERFCDRLAREVHDHDCWRDVSPNGTHRNYENDRAAEIARLLEEHRVVRDPARVTYNSHPVFRRQAAGAGITHLLGYDGVYWVSGIRWPEPPVDGGCAVQDCLESPDVPTWPTDPGTPRRVTGGEGISSLDVRTYGFGDGEPVAEDIPDDPSPTLVRRGIVLRPGEPVEPRNAFDLEVARVLALDLDLARMGLTLETPLTGSLAGDGDLVLGLVAPGEECAATLDGAPISVAREGPRLVLEVSLGEEPGTLEVACS